MIFTLIAIAILMTNCGRNLLKYSIYDEEVSDLPIKTQIKLKILIAEKDSITEQKLEDLLTYLYNLQMNRTDLEYHNHPNAVLIWAYTTQEKANAGDLWIAMISKMYYDTKPDFKINKIQFNALSIVAQDKWGLTQEKREEIWEKLIYTWHKARKEANKKYPLEKPGITLYEINKNDDLVQDLKEKYKIDLAKEYKIDRAILDSITFEGLESGWVFPE